MSQPEAARKSGRKIDWYKWLAGVIVPLVAALIGVKFFGGGGEKQTANNFTLVTDVTVIENQYQQATGQPLNDENLKQLIQSAVNLAKAGQNEASLKLFQEVASSVPVAAVYNNIGALNAETGNLSASNHAFQQALAKDPSYKPAQHNLEKMGSLFQQGHEFEHASTIQVGKKAAGAITDASVSDFYQFTTPPGPRDIYQVALENGSTTLEPNLMVFDGNHHQLRDCGNTEPLVHAYCAFPAEGQSEYYLQVEGHSNSVGPYSLVVTSLKRADRYEPNDDFPQATRISLDSTIEANIMDDQDVDFYLVRSGSKTGQLTASLENNSTTLDPDVTVFDGNRQQLHRCYYLEPVAHVDCTFSAEAQADYYVRVAGQYSTAGAYKLTVK